VLMVRRYICWSFRWDQQIVFLMNVSGQHSASNVDEIATGESLGGTAAAILGHPNLRSGVVGAGSGLGERDCRGHRNLVNHRG